MLFIMVGKYNSIINLILYKNRTEFFSLTVYYFRLNSKQLFIPIIKHAGRFNMANENENNENVKKLSDFLKKNEQEEGEPCFCDGCAIARALKSGYERIMLQQG